MFELIKIIFFSAYVFPFNTLKTTKRVLPYEVVVKVQVFIANSFSILTNILL